MTVIDADIGEDDRIDDFIILFSDQLTANSVFSPTITQNGVCGRATLSVRIRITSLCPANRYGPSCDRVCVDVPGQRTCNYLGEPECLGNFAPPTCNQCITGFQLPTCVTCAQDYFPQNICNVFCQPQDNATGHFTCDSNGNQVCLPGYTGPNCAFCIGNFREPDCRVCDPNFQGPNCNTCIQDYYPQGICNVFCQPRNDSGGHFTCDPVTGDRVCLPGYTGSNCAFCIGNFREPDCTECDPKFQGIDCNMCAQDYYPQGICNRFCQPQDNATGHFSCDSNGNQVCLPGYTGPNCAFCIGNFREPDCRVCDPNFQGLSCNTCTQDYYPQGVCDTFCQPQDNAAGHFTCNSLGRPVCLPRYTGSSTNCVTCDGNFQEPDCTECDPNFQGPNCNTCIQDYYPQGTCDTFCQPRNDSGGRFTCDDDGDRVCLPGYENPSRNCVDRVQGIYIHHNRV